MSAAPKHVKVSDNPLPVFRPEDILQKKATENRCGNRWRFVIALQGSLFLASIMGNVIGWNAALIKVAELETSPLHPAFLNGSEVDWTDPNLPISDRRVDISSVQISLLFAASFAGSGFFVLPATYCMKRFGTYRTMVALMTLTVIATALTPWATVTNFYILLVIRVLQGMAQCNPYPVIGAIVSSWATSKERGIFVSVLTGYTQLSAVITTPVASFLANEYGWPSVFYFQAAFCGTLLVIWAINYRDDPQDHPLVGAKEFRKISTGKISSSSQEDVSKIPFYRIFLKPSIWAVYISGYCFIIATQFNISFFTMYLVWVLNHPITLAGIITAVPLVIQFIIQFFTGLMSDKLTIMSERTKMRLFCTISFFGCGIGFIICTFIPPENKWTSTIFMVISLCLLGFNSGGFPKSIVLISQQKPAIIMGFMQAFLTLGLLSGSFITPGLTSGRSFKEYSLLFRFYGGLLIFANILFFIFCKSKPEDFRKKPNFIVTNVNS